MAAGRLVHCDGEFVPESDAWLSVFASAVMFGFFDWKRKMSMKNQKGTKP